MDIIYIQINFSTLCKTTGRLWFLFLAFMYTRYQIIILSDIHAQ